MGKTVNTKKFDPKKLIVLIAVAVLLVSSALAWFVYTANPFSNTFSLSNFQTQLDCYFMKGQTRTEITNFVDTDTKVINLSFDPAENNYFADFRVDAKYKGSGYGYLRVKVVTQAKDSNGVVTMTDSTNIPFTVYAAYSESLGNNEAAWYDNRNMDFCYYYATALSGSSTDYTTLSLITGASTTDLDSGFDVDFLSNNGYTFAVAVESDMVQINRYPQFWNINRLPWKS